MTTITQQTLSGWGRYPVARSGVLAPRTSAELDLPAEGSLICRGRGRSYGDAAISSHGLVLQTHGMRRMVSFDGEAGVLCAESGVTIEDILRAFVPHGWFPAVTPGTRYVSLGGAVAADVHGKNHHRDGSFGNHVLDLEVLLADGSRQRCSPTTNADLFWATVGGMGLTGVITRVSLQLVPIESSLMMAEHFQARDLETTMRWLDDPAHDDRYTIAWIDSLSRGRHLGRGIVMRGHHAATEELPPRRRGLRAPRRRYQPRVPFDFPGFVLNPRSVAAFNAGYYALQGRKKGTFLTDYEPFFYPLDGIRDWNRIYGRRGFLQYQIMIPASQSEAGIAFVLERLARSGRPSFLTTLKRFGPGNAAPLSFPGPGHTLAMDLPMTGADVLAELDKLDQAVVRFGGRVYLAKDARLGADTVRAMYPRLDEWLRVKRRVDPEGRFASDQSRRLRLDAC